MGLASGEPPEAWLLEHPEKVADLHRRFVEAGSDIVLTNSFGADALPPEAARAARTRTRELNRIAASIARKVADESGRDVVVAGSMGPTGELFAPLGALTMDAAVAAFTEQARGLAEGGADVAWIETMSAAEELEAAARGAIAAGPALRLHGELRHGRAHHDGPHARGAGRARRAPAGRQPVAYRRELRHRPRRSRRVHPGHERRRARRRLRRQGQLRHSHTGSATRCTMAARRS